MAEIILSTMQIKRGLKANLPTLLIGELAYCTDTKEFYVGTAEGNVLINGAGTGGGSVPSNVILFEDWVGGESVTIDTSVGDTTAPVLTITAGGTFTGTKSVTMSANETADIYYTLNGTTPTTASPKYTAPLSINATTTLKAFARDIAGNQSAVQTVTYTLDTTAPADTTAPNNVTNLATSNITQTGLTLSWTASTSTDVASYDVFKGTTLIGNVATTSFNVSGLTASTAYTFVVKAKDAANNSASGTSVSVTTTAPAADTTAPVLTMTAAATFADTQTVNMSANETADIWYTVDGSDPVTSGTRVKYTAPVTLTATTTVKAYAVDTAGNASGVQTVTYTKQQAVGGYVNDASLLLFQPTVTNGTTLANPDNYFQGANQWTVSFTVKPNATDVMMLSRLNPNSYKFEYTWNNFFKYSLYNTKSDGTTKSYPTVQTTAMADLTRFYHVVIVRDATYTTLYVDNVKIGQVSTTNETIDTSTSSVKLGFKSNGTTVATAEIKNFAYYNRALPSEELTQNYNALK